MIYVDFDSVIMDTYLPIFREYHERIKNGDFVDDVKWVQTRDWNEVLRESKEINEAFKYLKEREDATILTKIHSMDNEGKAKIEFVREKGLKNDIILVPYQFKKTDIVKAKGNVLIDDAINNLDDFRINGGIGIFFNKDNLDYDGWGIKNTRYVKVRSLNILRKF